MRVASTVVLVIFGSVVTASVVAPAGARLERSVTERPTTWEFRDCRTRGEGSSPQRLPTPAGQRIGPLIIWPSVRGRTSRTGDPAWPYVVKAPVVLPARTNVVLVIAPEATAKAAFQQVVRQGYGSAVRFEACRAGVRAWAYGGTVGKLTGFPFAIGLKQRSACIPLELWIDGQESPIRRTVPVGRPSC